MSEEDEFRRQFEAKLKEMGQIEDALEREAFAKKARVSLGAESRYRSYGKGWLSKFWNWLINADRSYMAFAPIWPILLGLAVIGYGIFVWRAFYG